LLWQHPGNKVYILFILFALTFNMVYVLNFRESIVIVITASVSMVMVQQVMDIAAATTKNMFDYYLSVLFVK